MRSQIIFLVYFILAAVITAAAQSVSVTNASLETYKQDRLKNEREYRENYERLGLPSPEEIDRRTAETEKEMAELSARLRAEQIERERIGVGMVALYQRQPIFVERSTTIIFSNFWRKRRHHFGPHPQAFGQPGYFAGGQFWRTGSRPANSTIRNVQEANGAPR